jgi:quinol monooxygenase YgiN
MNIDNTGASGQCVHLVTLKCKDREHAARCMEALATHGRPDAIEFGCVSYEFGIRLGTADTVCIVEHWQQWQDLDALLTEKVIPALPMYNQLLQRPFDPATDTVRVSLSSG